MTSPGGRIEIRVDPDLRGFASKTASGLSDAAKTGVAAFASAAKVALVGAAVGISAAAIVATKSTLDIGIAYQDQLNTLQAVSGATDASMKDVSATAKELGSDLTLPATSAADAAAVMTELAKASFTVQEAQDAAKGSLQLAAAAQIDGARAAEIQANAINAFSLKATDATRVADVLANAANASSAEITDIADALAQASAVAASANISIEDTATVLGILANNGIKGSDAGTLLKSALLALQSPSNAAQKAMDDLGLTAYDAQGNFVGLRSIFDQLQDAQSGMTQQQYEMATSTLFGSDAARLAGIAAKEGGEGFDLMAGAIGRQGAAADVAAAKSKGLGGAIEAFKSQVETVQIDIFERAAPSLERLVRAAAERLPEVADRALEAADKTVAYFTDMAPRIGRVLEARQETVQRGWDQLAKPILDGAADLGPEVLDLVGDVAEKLADVAGDALDQVEPLAQAVGKLLGSLDDADGPLDAVGGGLELVAGATGAALNAAEPLIDVLTFLVDGFADLSGPIQTTVIALGALKLLTNADLFGRLASGDSRVGGSLGRAGQSVVGFAQTVRANMSLADESVGGVERTFGALSTGVQTYLPRTSTALGNFTGSVRSAFDQAKQLQQLRITELLGPDAVSRSTGDLSGFTAAAKTAATTGIGGLRAAGGGLVSFLGGPWGVALAAGGLAVGAISSQMAAAEAQTDAWAQALLNGGKAAKQAAADAKSNSDGWFNSLTDAGQFGDQTSLFERMFGGDDDKKFAEAEQRARELYDAMDPLSKAEQNVRHDTAQLSLAIEDFGVKSPEAAAAADALERSNERLARRSREVDEATRGAADAIVEQTNQLLAATNADVALSNSMIGVRDAQAAYNQVMADGTATADQRLSAENNLVSSYTSAASAAAAKAAADNAGAGESAIAAAQTQAQVEVLQRMVAEAGGNAPAAVLQLIDSLTAAGATGLATAALMDGVTGSVQRIPNSKDVRVNGITAEAEQTLSALGYTVTHMPDGSVRISANTAEAQAKLDSFVAQQRTISVLVRATMPDLNGSVSGSGRPGLSGGGYTGDGGKYEVAPFDVHRGEYVEPKEVTKVARPLLEAIHRQDWRAAMPHLMRLADRQSRATVAAAVAGRTAAARAGSYAAGGYVDAQLRRETAGAVTTVPVPVGDVVGAQYNGPVYLVDPEEQARVSRRNVRAALVSSGLGRRA